MKDYTVIGTVYSRTTRKFYHGLLRGGISRALKANVNDVCAIYAREITKDEIHSRIQQKQSCGGGK